MKSKMRTKITTMAGLMAVSLAFTGCAGKQANETSAQTEAATAEETSAQAETVTEQSEAESAAQPTESETKNFEQRLEPVEPVDGTVAAAAGMLDWGDVANSPYFTSNDYYNGTGISDTLVLIDHFKTYQQTSERSCGAASVLMTVNYLTGEAPGEDTLDKEMDIRYLDNKREDGSYGATTASIAEALKNRGFDVQSSADTADADGYSFYDEKELAEFLKGKLKEKKPVIMENVEWGGHWMVLIGYDDMGTDDIMLDDVLVFADSYDTSDQCQDGYYTMNFERYVSQWFDYQVMGENEKIQQYVTLK